MMRKFYLMTGSAISFIFSEEVNCVCNPMGKRKIVRIDSGVFGAEVLSRDWRCKKFLGTTG